MGRGFDGGMSMQCYGRMPPMGTYYQNKHAMHYTCNVWVLILTNLTTLSTFL
jgi:hypothetical protein